MLFTSVEYFIFLGLLFGIYYLLPLKLRWLPVLLFSTAFCAYASLNSLIVLVVTVIVFYFLGILIEKNNGGVLVNSLKGEGTTFSIKYFK